MTAPDSQVLHYERPSAGVSAAPGRRSLMPGALALVVLSSGVAIGQPIEIRPGVLVPEVAAKEEPGQTYALYLPSAYDPGRKWPALYAFDPMARGSVPIECYREAAEEHGFIVVASNVSRNGPMAPSLRAGIAVIRDSALRFSIDERRLYATGFSGGARVACALAHGLGGSIAAVVGSGAGFPQDLRPSADTPFAFCGTIGDEDFNWTEMNQLERTLESLGKPHRLLRFHGGHVWPPNDVARRAVEWLELLAMRTGTRTPDAVLVERLLHQDLERAEAQESAGALREAWSGYADIAAAFRGLTDVKPFDAKVAALRSHALVRKQLKREKDEEDDEVRQSATISQLVGQLSDPELRVDSASQIRTTIAVLKREEKDASSPSKRLLARRLLEHVSITAYYAAQPLSEAGDHESARRCLELQAAVHPESAAVQYRLALNYAQAGDKKKAVESLKSAAAKGFWDVARVEKESAFERLRGDPHFLRVLEEIRANKKPS